MRQPGSDRKSLARRYSHPVTDRPTARDEFDRTTFGTPRELPLNKDGMDVLELCVASVRVLFYVLRGADCVGNRW